MRRGQLQAEPENRDCKCPAQPAHLSPAQHTRKPHYRCKAPIGCIADPGFLSVHVDGNPAYMRGFKSGLFDEACSAIELAVASPGGRLVLCSAQ